MKDQTTFENMHEKRFNNHFTTNPLVIPINGDGGFDEADITLLKEITRDAHYAVKEREKMIEDTEDCEYDCDKEECLANGCPRYGECVFTRGEKKK